MVFDNSPLGMQEPWAAIVSSTESLSAGATILLNMDTYKIPLPQSICENAPLNGMTFCSAGPRPATLAGLPKDKLSELVRILITTVHRDFQTCYLPENYLAKNL